MVLKPMFTRNGFNIYPKEIELVIREMPGVEEAFVVAGVHPEREMDIVVGFRGTASVDEVRAWCAARLSAYKQPTVIDYVENFVNASG